MSPLQQRMIEDMQLRGLSARTQEAYARAVWQLAQHYHRRPDQLSEEELRQYFLYLANEKKIARPTATIALCGIKFFYEQTLKQEWPTLRFVRPPREWKLPVVLSRKEVRRILHEVRIPVYRACLTTIYACGLRLLEGTRLQVADVDSARMLLHIHGKSKKDRYVPLPAPTLQLLRTFWRTHRSPVWLFPAPTRHGLAHSLAHDGGPVTRSSLQSAFRMVGILVDFLGINPMKALLWTAVINGVLSPPLLLIIMLVSSNRNIMGDKVNGVGANIVGWTATAIMFAAAIGMILTWNQQ